jgi:hypothetical protein
MRHRWTTDDDAALLAAVEGCLPMREALAEQPRIVWWAAVCGRLALPDVTPDAARSRWERLARDRRAAQAEELAREAADAMPSWSETDSHGRRRCIGCRYPVEAVMDGGHGPGCPHDKPDGWERTNRLVEEYEAMLAERTLQTATEIAAGLAQMQRSQARTELMLVALCRAWDVAVEECGS